MAGVAKRIDQYETVLNGNTSSTNLKFNDKIPVQHIDTASNKNKTNNVNTSQLLCQPYLECSSQQSGGVYSADCVNYPDFSISSYDGSGNESKLVGLKIRVKFTYGCNYGDTTQGTYPSLNAAGSGALPMLAQGTTMGTGAFSNGQVLEFTLIPYGSGYAWDCDSNVRQVTNDYTIHADGTLVHTRNTDFITLLSEENVFVNYKIQDGIIFVNCVSLGGFFLNENTYTEIAQIPNYSRKLDVYFPVNSLGGSAICYGRINASGLIEIYSNSATNYFSFTAITY